MPVDPKTIKEKYYKPGSHTNIESVMHSFSLERRVAFGIFKDLQKEDYGNYKIGCGSSGLTPTFGTHV